MQLDYYPSASVLLRWRQRPQRLWWRMWGQRMRFHHLDHTYPLLLRRRILRILLPTSEKITHFFQTKTGWRSDGCQPASFFVPLGDILQGSLSSFTLHTFLVNFVNGILFDHQIQILHCRIIPLTSRRPFRSFPPFRTGILSIIIVSHLISSLSLLLLLYAATSLPETDRNPEIPTDRFPFRAAACHSLSAAYRSSP